VIFTWVNSVYKQKYVFLDDFDEGEWDLGLQAKEWTRPSHKCNLVWQICATTLRRLHIDLDIHKKYKVDT
jgi:hypothetical protein